MVGPQGEDVQEVLAQDLALHHLQTWVSMLLERTPTPLHLTAGRQGQRRAAHRAGRPNDASAAGARIDAQHARPQEAWESDRRRLVVDSRNLIRRRVGLEEGGKFVDRW